MLMIARMPRKSKRFFKPVQRHFTPSRFNHFWQLVLALTICHGATLQRLADALADTTHRTNHGEFLWRSDWDESWVLQAIALDTLRRLHRMGVTDPRCYFILDDTQTLKRAKKMQGVGKLYHHASKTWGRGHTILKVCLHIGGVTIPWGSYLYLKKEHAAELDLPFVKLTDLAARAIAQAQLPERLRVTVLFDAFYLCPKVTRACRDRRWHYVSVGKCNRCFVPQGCGQVKKLGAYGGNVLRRAGRWQMIQGPGQGRARDHRLAWRIGHLRGLGRVKVVFSRRRGERKQVALVTDDVRASASGVVLAYLKRWSIEVLIKDEKQHLGLGDYRCWRYRAVVRHLHLVDCAHACLTHLALDAHQDAQGAKTKQVLHVPPISQLKDRMRQRLWAEAVDDVVRVTHDRKVIRRLEKWMKAA